MVSPLSDLWRRRSVGEMSDDSTRRRRQCWLDKNQWRIKQAFVQPAGMPWLTVGHFFTSGPPYIADQVQSNLLLKPGHNCVQGSWVYRWWSYHWGRVILFSLYKEKNLKRKPEDVRIKKWNNENVKKMTAEYFSALQIHTRNDGIIHTESSEFKLVFIVQSINVIRLDFLTEKHQILWEDTISIEENADSTIFYSLLNFTVRK